MQATDWVLWNVFLAVIPVGAAYLLTWGFERFTLWEKRIPWYLWAPVAFLWLAFLPNSCYLLTEWRHFLFDPTFVALRDAAEHNRSYMINVAQWSLFFLVYTGTGVITFALSIRPIEQLMRRRKIPILPFAAPFFFLTSLGVYLGLIVRLNSWDLYRQPGNVLRIAVAALINPTLFSVIFGFAVFLWLLYLAADIWVDGLRMRMKAQA